MDKQELARNRNWLKFQLAGKAIRYSEKYVTPAELEVIEEVNQRINLLIKHFNNQSRNLGLNGPEHKCHINPCKRKAKHIETVYGKEIYFCKKHFNEYLEAYGME